MANDNNTHDHEFQPLTTSRGDQHNNDQKRKKCSPSSAILLIASLKKHLVEVMKEIKNPLHQDIQSVDQI